MRMKGNNIERKKAIGEAKSNQVSIKTKANIEGSSKKKYELKHECSSGYCPEFDDNSLWK